MEENAMKRNELVDRIDRSWRELDDLASNVDDELLRAPVSDGWTVKDHLVHLAAWEESLLALLEGRDRAAAMGVPGMEDAGTEAINAAVFDQHRDQAPDQALAGFRQTHRRLLDRLAQLSDEDLSRPYSDFQPGTGEERPVGGWVAGNTFEHYAEHLSYIRPALPTGSRRIVIRETREER
jgi:uncharacterized protein (TIGR03083 family)